MILILWLRWRGRGGAVDFQLQDIKRVLLKHLKVRPRKPFKERPRCKSWVYMVLLGWWEVTIYLAWNDSASLWEPKVFRGPWVELNVTPLVTLAPFVSFCLRTRVLLSQVDPLMTFNFFIWSFYSPTQGKWSVKPMLLGEVTQSTPLKKNQKNLYSQWNFISNFGISWVIVILFHKV